MSSTDIDNLVDMGFDREKATLAMKKTGNRALILVFLDSVTF